MKKILSLNKMTHIKKENYEKKIKNALFISCSLERDD